MTGRLIWTDSDQQVLLHLDSLRVRINGAWVEAELDIQPLHGRRHGLHLAHHAGIDETGNTVRAIATIEGRPSPPRFVEFLHNALGGASA